MSRSGRDLDEDDVRVRPGRRKSRPRSKDRPSFDQALPGTVITVDAVLAAVQDRLARFKQPKAAVILADLPRNTMGKVQKNLLRDQHKGLFA